MAKENIKEINTFEEDDNKESMSDINNKDLDLSDSLEDSKEELLDDLEDDDKESKTEDTEDVIEILSLKYMDMSHQNIMVEFTKNCVDHNWYSFAINNSDNTEKIKLLALEKINNKEMNIEEPDDPWVIESAFARMKRNDLLKDTDYIYSNNTLKYADNFIASMNEYRQKLRDITDQAKFPSKIEWPEIPTVIELSKSSDEYKSNQIREERNRLLDETDKFMVIDSILSEDEIKEMRNYRKSLRDISLQKSFPNVELPKLPSFLSKSTSGRLEYQKETKDGDK